MVWIAVIAAILVLFAMLWMQTRSTAAISRESFTRKTSDAPDRPRGEDRREYGDAETMSREESQRWVPLNVMTRGAPRDYTQVGVISTLGGGRVGDESDPRILPLYGRPTYAGSHLWNFYTTTDGFHLLRIPVFYKNRNCTAEYGCEEVSDGDYVRVEEYGTTFRVRLYENDQIRYIPL